ncbi:MAG: hypothetical protein EA387_02635 [Nitriliruptor sp.]|nr:MAG: hypothetical protein EA387_02635 [Nitriliruptor sp.]
MTGSAARRVIAPAAAEHARPPGPHDTSRRRGSEQPWEGCVDETLDDGTVARESNTIEVTRQPV